jgi:hypothetical protein
MDTSPSSDSNPQIVLQKLKVYFNRKLPVHFTVIGSNSIRNGTIKEFDEEGGFIIINDYRDGEELLMFTEIYQDSISIYKPKEGTDSGGFSSESIR